MARALVDWLVMLCLLYFIFSCVFIERHYCAAPLKPDHSDPLLKATYDYAAEWNPLFLARPAWLKVATCFSAYGLLCGYVMLFCGFLFQINAVRTLGLMFVGFKMNAIAFYFWMELVEHGVPSLAMFLAAEGAYPLGMALIIFRLRAENPFGAAQGPNAKKIK